MEAVTKDGEVISLSDVPALRGRVLRCGWELPEDLTEAEWRAAGEFLGKIEANISWWIGDWWAFGEHRYGSRKAVVEAENWEGPAFKTCANAASVCRAFETSRRREVLSFRHHAEVAMRSPAEADALLDWAEEPIREVGKPRSTQELRAEVNRRRPPLGSGPNQITCSVADLWQAAVDGRRWGCIYADPPWLYDNQQTRAATSNHYAGMTVDELCALPVGKIAAEDAHLHLWTTNGFLFETPRIFAAWGFEFRSSFVWIKPDIGIGNYWRNAHEFLLTAVRGNAKRFNDHNLQSWLRCGRGSHSQKPEQVRGMLERASPGPYLELFARSKSDHWDVWGDQIERTLFYPTEAAAE